MKLQKYINDTYDGASDWFVEECVTSYNQTRIMDILDKKEYLAGQHRIKLLADFKYNGKTIRATKICLQYAKMLLNFQTSFLLRNPITLTNADEKTLGILKDIYNKSDYDSLDIKIMSKMLKYGQVYEYPYLDDDMIKSKIINPEDGYPVYSHTGEYIAFIEHYIINGISYYIVFTPDRVYEYTNRNNEGNTYLTNEYSNLSGLPCIYKIPSELDETIGQSEIDDWTDIIDAMEKLLSKYTDSLHKFLNPIPVVTGNKLVVGKNGEGSPSKDIAGFALELDNDSTFNFAETKMDSTSLKELFRTLKQCLLDISCTPAISMNSQELSNLSEVSIKILYNLATVKATFNALYLKEGFKQRWKCIKRLLSLNSINIDNNIDCEFEVSIPQNAKDIIDNLKQLKDMGVISDTTIMEKSPYIHDMAKEQQRIMKQNTK